MRRDAINMYNNDHLAVLFDTFNDRRNGFGFSSNAQGGMFDWQVTNEQPSNNWNGLWDVAGRQLRRRLDRRDSSSRSDRCDSRKAATSGASISAAWCGGATRCPICRRCRCRGAGAACPRCRRAGPLVGIETAGASSGTWTSSPTRSARSPATSWRRRRSTTTSTAEFGVDAKWGITQSLFADFTYNTDFAQVEDDEAQVNLTRFSCAFPEKRDFFLEGQDVFNFGGGRRRWRGGGAAARVAAAAVATGGRAIPPTTRRWCSSAAASACRTARSCRSSPAPECWAAVARSRWARFTCGPRRAHARHPGHGFLGVPLQPGHPEPQPHRRHRHPAGAPASRAPRTTPTAWTRPSTRARISRSPATGPRTEDTTRRRPTSRAIADNSTGTPTATGFQVEHCYVGGGFNPEIGFLRRTAFRAHLWLGALQPAAEELAGRAQGVLRRPAWTTTTTPAAPESREVQGTFRMEFTTSDQWASSTQAVRGDVAPFRVTTGVVRAGRRVRVRPDARVSSFCRSGRSAARSR